MNHKKLLATPKSPVGGLTKERQCDLQTDGQNGRSRIVRGRRPTSGRSPRGATKGIQVLWEQRRSSVRPSLRQSPRIRSSISPRGKIHIAGAAAAAAARARKSGDQGGETCAEREFWPPPPPPTRRHAARRGRPANYHSFAAECSAVRAPSSLPPCLPAWLPLSSFRLLFLTS